MTRQHIGGIRRISCCSHRPVFPGNRCSTRRRRWIRYRVLSAVLLAGLSGSFPFWTGCGSPADRPGSPPVIAVVPKGTTHLFWRQIEAGARAAGSDFDVDILWKGPVKENDRAAQISIVEQLITQGVSGLVLAPLDDTALLRPVRQAAKKGVPVLIFDTELKGEAGKDFVSFVATDNLLAGRLAGQYMGRLLEESGQVGVMRYQVGSGSTTAREEGFLKMTREMPGFRVTLENQYGGVTVGETLEKSEGALDTLRGMDGIFCPTEPTTYGVLLALRKHGLTGRTRLIGFDSSDELLAALRKGEIDALILQDPVRMAYLAVETIVRHLRGETVPLKIATEVRLVTRENLGDPAIRALLDLE